MTNQELADWFGILEKSFRSTRAKKLETLKEYAEFENLRGKVNIIKVIKPIYQKRNGGKNYNFIKEKTKEQWSETGLDTCKLVADKIKKKYKDTEEIKALKETTIYSYTTNSKKEYWGIAFKDNGEIGRCVYEMCKEINGKCIEFTEEEKKIKNKIQQKYFGNEVSEKLIFIKDMLENKEITEEECWQELEKIANIENRYWNYRNELEKVFNCKITRATRVTTNAFKVQEGKFEFQKGVKLYVNSK